MLLQNGAAGPTGRPEPSQEGSPRRVYVAATPLDVLDFDGATQWVLDRARGEGVPTFVVTPNAQHSVLLHDTPRFREAYGRAGLSIADGMSLVWASRLLGTPVPERVTGVDLFEGVCRAAAGTDIRIFLLGGLPGAAEGAARLLEQRYPGLRIAGTCCPPLGFEADAKESERVASVIRAVAPHILFVGLGAPKQEFWMQENLPALGVPVGVGVGGAFDMISGQKRRAPSWMQRVGAEWLFRLAVEPRRLGKRYTVDNARFIALVLRDRLRRRRRG